MPTISPHSRPGKLAVVDGRSAEARLMADIRADLIRHVGGHPTAIQSMLIDLAASLTLRIRQADRKTLRQRDTSDVEAHQHLAWTTTLSRILEQQRGPPPPPAEASAVIRRGKRTPFEG
jgi:hypothetical protein